MKDGYEKEVIIKDICSILQNDFQVKKEITSDKWESPLTSFFFGLTAVQLYQLLMVVEEKYRVYFSAAEIKDNGFFTILEISDLIQRHL